MTTDPDASASETTASQRSSPPAGSPSSEGTKERPAVFQCWSKALDFAAARGCPVWCRVGGSTRKCFPSTRPGKSKLEILADLLDMPAEDVREAARNIARKRMEGKHAGLMEKVRLIRERNTAILPTGEIVARGTLGAMDYDSPENDKDLARRALVSE